MNRHAPDYFEAMANVTEIIPAQPKPQPNILKSLLTFDEDNPGMAILGDNPENPLGRQSWQSWGNPGHPKSWKIWKEKSWKIQEILESWTPTNPGGQSWTPTNSILTTWRDPAILDMRARARACDPGHPRTGIFSIPQSNWQSNNWMEIY
jgi:hypothetical protein